MRLPTYEEIARDEEQLEVYETPFDESLFVVGPPGSGKTVLAVHRAQMLASDGITVVLITYNRMLRRLIAQLTEDQIETQTMHQFVSARYLAQTNAGAPCTAPYVYDWNAMFATWRHTGTDARDRRRRTRSSQGVFPISSGFRSDHRYGVCRRGSGAL